MRFVDFNDVDVAANMCDSFRIKGPQSKDMVDSVSRVFVRQKHQGAKKLVIVVYNTVSIIRYYRSDISTTLLINFLLYWFVRVSY